MQNQQHKSSTVSSEPSTHRSPLRTIQANCMYQTPPPPPRPSCRTCEVFDTPALYSGDLLIPTFPSFDDDNDDCHDVQEFGEESPRDARHIIMLNPRAKSVKFPGSFASKSPFSSSVSICSSSPSEPDLDESFDISDDDKEEILVLTRKSRRIVQPRSWQSGKCPSFPGDDCSDVSMIPRLHFRLPAESACTGSFCLNNHL